MQQSARIEESLGRKCRDIAQTFSGLAIMRVHAKIESGMLASLKLKTLTHWGDQSAQNCHLSGGVAIQARSSSPQAAMQQLYASHR